MLLAESAFYHEMAQDDIATFPKIVSNYTNSALRLLDSFPQLGPLLLAELAFFIPNQRVTIFVFFAGIKHDTTPGIRGADK